MRGADAPTLTQMAWACWSLRMASNATGRELTEKEGERRRAEEGGGDARPGMYGPSVFSAVGSAWLGGSHPHPLPTPPLALHHPWLDQGHLRWDAQAPSSQMYGVPGDLCAPHAGPRPLRTPNSLQLSSQLPGPCSCWSPGVHSDISPLCASSPQLRGPPPCLPGHPTRP